MEGHQLEPFIPEGAGQAGEAARQVRERSRKELYVKGRTAVWSSGEATNKCFALEERILEAMRVTFHTCPSCRCIRPSSLHPNPPVMAPPLLHSADDIPVSR